MTNYIDPEELKKHLEAGKHLPKAKYDIVTEHGITPTADFVVTRKGMFLLAKRAEAPFKHQWFVPGGRMVKGELPQEACIRQAERELGIKGAKPIFHGHLMVTNPKSETRPYLWESLWHLYEIPIGDDVVIKPNKENLEIGWFEDIDEAWPDPVKNALLMMGFEY